MNKKVTLIDYGMGNIKSLKNAINKLGFEYILYSEKNEISSNIVIIPGVGGFNHASDLFKKKKIDTKIIKFTENKNNFLIGICLGMQLFLTYGNENGKSNGLNLINGSVDIISKLKQYRLPNVGWKKTHIKESKNFIHLKEFDKEEFYYVHSYKVNPKKKENIIGYSDFNGLKFSSIITNGHNVIGTQFHPEKSGEIGLQFLERLISKI